MRKYLFVIPLMALLSSCIGLTNISTPQTVALSEGNFKFVKTVSAETKALYVFGIGGFKDEANEDVVEKLRLRANLQQNQALADIRVKSTTKTYFGIVTKRTLTAAASVVEFKDSETNTFATTDLESVKENSNLRIDSNNQIYVEGGEDLSIRKLEYERLKIINGYLKNGYKEDLDIINNEVDRISQWYSSIPYTYPEIHNILKEIKKRI